VDNLNQIGETVYIGNRTSSKFFRVYDKGCQVYRSLEGITSDNSEFQGAMVRDWVRAELELKNGHIEIPMEALINHDSYFAGAYSFLELIMKAEVKIPKSVCSESKADFIRMGQNHKSSYGSHLYVLRNMGYTDKQIVDYLIKGCASNRMIESGFLELTIEDTKNIVLLP
jgi:phage replication initiation protein